MTLLSTDLKQLHATFDGWGRGDPFPTEEAWLKFGLQLKAAIARAALLELGIKVDMLGAGELDQPTNIVPFPAKHIRRVPIDGGAA